MFPETAVFTTKPMVSMAVKIVFVVEKIVFASEKIVFVVEKIVVGIEKIVVGIEKIVFASEKMVSPLRRLSSSLRRLSSSLRRFSSSLRRLSLALRRLSLPLRRWSRSRRALPDSGDHGRLNCQSKLRQSRWVFLDLQPARVLIDWGNSPPDSNDPAQHRCGDQLTLTETLCLRKLLGNAGVTNPARRHLHGNWCHLSQAPYFRHHILDTAIFLIPGPPA